MTSEITTMNPYILNEQNMCRYLKYKQIDDITNSKSKSQSQSHQLFIPREIDSLFWCYFILSHGEAAYEMKHVKNVLITKQLKIQYIQKLRTNLFMLKPYKFDTMTNLESNLANDDLLNIQTMLALCATDNINIILVRQNSYIELLMSSAKCIYIVREIVDNRYNKRYGYEIATNELLEQVRKLYKVNSLDKPVRAISAYKVAELLEIAQKLGLETTSIITGKQKTKPELYEMIFHHLSSHV